MTGDRNRHAPDLAEHLLGGLRARGADPPGLTARGNTPGAILRHLSDLIETRNVSGTIRASIEMTAPEYGPHPGAGIYRDEPLIDRWRAEIEADRQQVEDDPVWF